MQVASHDDGLQGAWKWVDTTLPYGKLLGSRLGLALGDFTAPQAWLQRCNQLSWDQSTSPLEEAVVAQSHLGICPRMRIRLDQGN